MGSAGHKPLCRKTSKRPHVGQLIRAEMEARGLSVRALARLADRPVRDLRDLFAGGLPRTQVLEAIGRAFGTGTTLWLQLDAECRGPHRDDRSAALPIQLEPVLRVRRD
jgi:plasmid maintenance system antidote protein VapI